MTDRDVVQDDISERVLSYPFVYYVPVRVKCAARQLYEWEKLPVICKWGVIGGTGVLVSMAVWIFYRENIKNRRSLKLSPPNTLTELTPSEVATLEITTTPKVETIETNDTATMANFDEDEYVQIKLPCQNKSPDSASDGSVKDEITMPTGDANEIAISIHSQITRGLHDLQRGLELSTIYKERNGTTKIRRHSARPSVDSSPIVTSPSGESGSSTPQVKNRRRNNTERQTSTARRRLISTSSTASNEILDEVTNLLKSSDRLDRMIRSDDAISRILSHIRNDSDESIESDRTIRNSSSVSSIDSYMTACDEFEYSTFPFLTKGIELAEIGLVDSRKVRYQLFGQRSEREFLGKLYCIRKAEQSWLSDSATRNWLRDTGLVTISGLLTADGTDPEPFQEAFEGLVDWSWRHPEKTKDELHQLRVAEVSFFDVVLDWCILDAIDDLANPPSAIISVMGNRWLGNDFKRTGMTTAVWSYIKKKRSQLLTVDSFMGRFYDMSNTVTPTIAWGLLGPKTEYTELCRSFRAEIITLCQELFSYRDAWKTEAALKADIRELISKTFKRLFALLSDATKDKFDFVEPPLIN